MAGIQRCGDCELTAPLLHLIQSEHFAFFEKNVLQIVDVPSKRSPVVTMQKAATRHITQNIASLAVVAWAQNLLEISVPCCLNVSNSIQFRLNQKKHPLCILLIYVLKWQLSVFNRPFQTTVCAFLINLDDQFCIHNFHS